MLGLLCAGTPGGGDLTEGWEDGEERKECSTTCCCWTWHTEPASAGGAL